MTNGSSVFNAEYIIDGVRQELTPAQILVECLADGYVLPEEQTEIVQIVDEPANPDTGTFHYDQTGCKEYLAAVRQSVAFSQREVPAAYSGSFTRLMIAKCLIDNIWANGHFSLNEITVDLEWNWNCEPVGNMAAFYFSVEAAGQYLYDLGVRIRKCILSPSADGNRFSVCSPEAWHETLEESLSSEDAAVGFRIDSVMPDTLPSVEKIGGRMCRDTIVSEGKTWLIYIPFDTCSYRLGGSLLTEIFGENGDAAPDVRDPDYFIDCYEVVRELVEDGVILSGVTVAGGGLMAASDNFCSKTGCEINVSGIESAYSETDKVRILFSEVPGVLVQIRDSDYDYVDSQLLLQDVAYYPVGQPDLTGRSGVRISEDRRPDVLSILSALLQEQQSEGED